MLRLTREEQIFIACVLLAVLTGSVVKHLRYQYLLKHPPVVAAATPRPKPPYVELPKPPPVHNRSGSRKNSKKSIDEP